MGPAPKVLGWEDAAEVLAEVFARLLTGAPSVVVGVTGPVGSGKTTLAQRLSGCVVGTDCYLPDYDAVAYEDRDKPEMADFPRLAADLSELRAGRHAEVPVWSFQTHRREGYRRMSAAPVVVCEGIHALYAPVLPHLDVRVFVDAPRGVRWSRWEALEKSGERGWGVEKARVYFDEVAEPTFGAVAGGYRGLVDYVVVNDGRRTGAG